MKTRETALGKDSHTRTTLSTNNPTPATQNSALAPARTPASTTRPETSLQGKLQLKATRKFGALLGLS